MSFQGELWLPENQPRRKQVEAVQLAKKALRAWERHTETTLSPEDFEDAHATLVEVAWKLSRRFDPDRGVAVDAYIYGILVRRANDFLRSRLGRTKWTWKTHSYEKPRDVAPLSLDAPSGGDDSRSLGELVASPDSATQESWNAALGWLHATRDSEAATDRRVINEALLGADAAGVSAEKRAA